MGHHKLTIFSIKVQTWEQTESFTLRTFVSFSTPTPWHQIHHSSNVGLPLAPEKTKAPSPVLFLLKLN